MRLFILCTIFIPLTSLATVCENFTGTTINSELCFDTNISGWISKYCLTNKKCDARKFFLKKIKITPPTSVGGQNPAASYCHELRLPVVVLRDVDGNEQSMCQFKDKSLLDSNAIERFLE